MRSKKFNEGSLETSESIYKPMNKSYYSRFNDMLSTKYSGKAT